MNCFSWSYRRIPFQHYSFWSNAKSVDYCFSYISYIAFPIEKKRVYCFHFPSTQRENLFLIGECNIEVNIYDQMQQVKRAATYEPLQIIYKLMWHYATSTIRKLNCQVRFKFYRFILVLKIKTQTTNGTWKHQACFVKLASNLKV